MFADIESRVTAAVFAKLANTMATPAVGDPFPVTFDKAQGLVNELGIVTREPSLTMQPSAATVAKNDTLTIDAVAYKVREVVLLDEGGWQRVALVRA